MNDELQLKIIPTPNPSRKNGDYPLAEGNFQTLQGLKNGKLGSGMVFSTIRLKIIPTRSWQAYSKQVCLWDLAQIICIAFIIQVAWAI